MGKTVAHSVDSEQSGLRCGYLLRQYSVSLRKLVICRLVVCRLVIRQIARASIVCMATFGMVLTASAENVGIRISDNLDHLMYSYQSRGLKINTLGVAWRNKADILAGDIEQNRFDKFLQVVDSDLSYPLLFEAKKNSTSSTSQITLIERKGFSIAVEEPVESVKFANERSETLQSISGSPHLIVSWQGDIAAQGQYKMSVLGREIEVTGEHNGIKLDREELGWGIQLAGGWHFGDVFAALRVTIGDGIDSLLLRHFGSDVALSSSGDVETVESFSILPSLLYNIDDESDVRFSMGRYQSTDGEINSNIDTLDTVNLGYSWSPWPSTRIGVEVMNKDFTGNGSEVDSTEIKIGAETRF